MVDRNGKELKAGQVCKVHPAIRPDGTKSISRRPYNVIIVDVGVGEEILMTEKYHRATINDYLLKRLEIIK